jgi:DNA polymerase-3 subunit epsilon
VKNIKLERPLVSIDIESTGVNPHQDRIVEFSALTINPDGTESCWSARINPEMPIPTAAYKIHHISDDDVKDKPKFRECAGTIKQLLAHGDIAGYGLSRYDVPLLEAEFKRAGVEFSRRNLRIVDAQLIFFKQEPRDLTAAYKKYCGKALQNAHSSEADARATLEVLECQLAIHPDLPKDIQGLHCYCGQPQDNYVDSDGKLVWEGDEAAFNFGKYQGKKLKEVAVDNADYFSWILKKDFSDEVRDIITNALLGKFPTRP